jgi:hypothetical protein
MKIIGPTCVPVLLALKRKNVDWLALNEDNRIYLWTRVAANQSTFLLLITSYTGTQVGPIIFIQGQSVYILTV